MFELSMVRVNEIIFPGREDFRREQFSSGPISGEVNFHMREFS